MFAQCAYMLLSCVNVSILCVYACFCKDKGFYEDSLGQTGECGTCDTAKEMHSLFRYNKYRGL